LAVAGNISTQARDSVAPRAMWRAVWGNRLLIRRLAARELAARYRGSLLGAAWMAVNPLLMLAVYTFVFTVVFKARWGATPNGSSAEFALFLFSGMILYGVFSDVVTRAPSLMLENVSYIKKVVFPLEILPVVALASALANAAVGFVILLAFQLAVSGLPPWTFAALPIVLLPLCLLTAGLGWFLASLGVFLRDVRQMVGVFVTVLMFLSPIFYPIDMIPAEFRLFLHLNPLTPILEQSKDVLFRGRLPDPLEWAATTAFSAMVCWLGFAWFVKTRKGFADVV
jgi:lipopolysaccharide transport system permease protein